MIPGVPSDPFYDSIILWRQCVNSSNARAPISKPAVRISWEPAQSGCGVSIMRNTLDLKGRRATCPV